MSGYVDLGTVYIGGGKNKRIVLGGGGEKEYVLVSQVAPTITINLYDNDSGANVNGGKFYVNQTYTLNVKLTPKKSIYDLDAMTLYYNSKSTSGIIGKIASPMSIGESTFQKKILTADEPCSKYYYATLTDVKGNSGSAIQYVYFGYPIIYGMITDLTENQEKRTSEDIAKVDSELAAEWLSEQSFDYWYKKITTLSASSAVTYGHTFSSESLYLPVIIVPKYWTGSKECMTAQLGSNMTECSNCYVKTIQVMIGGVETDFDVYMNDTTVSGEYKFGIALPS